MDRLKLLALIANLRGNQSTKPMAPPIQMPNPADTDALLSSEKLKQLDMVKGQNALTNTLLQQKASPNLDQLETNNTGIAIQPKSMADLTKDKELENQSVEDFMKRKALQSLVKQ